MSTESEPTRKERKLFKKKKEIIEAAEQVFSGKGYHNATMNDIADQADLSVGTLYNFFKNKEELYTEIIIEKSGELIEQVDEIASEPIPAREKLARYIETKNAFHERNASSIMLLVSLIHDAASIGAEQKNKMRDTHYRITEQVIGRLTTIVKQAQKEGSIERKLDAVDIALAIDALVNNIVFRYIYEQMSEKKKPSGFKGKVEFIMTVLDKGIFNN